MGLWPAKDGGEKKNGNIADSVQRDLCLVRSPLLSLALRNTGAGPRRGTRHDKNRSQEVMPARQRQLMSGRVLMKPSPTEGAHIHRAGFDPGMMVMIFKRKTPR